MTDVARRRRARSAASITGQDLRVLVQDAADDPAVFVRLADESGTIPAAWCIGNGWPGASRIRRAVHDRVMHLEDNDRGFLHPVGDHVVLTIQVESNGTLPPILAQYAFPRPCLMSADAVVSQDPTRSVPRRSIAGLGAPPPSPVTTVKRCGCVLYLLPRRELACLREC